MFRRHQDLKRKKMFWKGREYGEAIELVDGPVTGQVTFYAILTLKKGEEIGYHQHRGEMEVFHFLKGAGEINDNGQIVHVSPGDVVTTGVDGWHGFKNTGRGELVFTALIVKQPTAA